MYILALLFAIVPSVWGEPRFFIQSIVQHKGGMMLRDYVDSSKTCRPPQVLFKDVEVKAPSASYKEITDSMHKDDVRLAYDFKQYWESTVMAEVNSILGTIKAQLERINEDQQATQKAKDSGETLTDRAENVFPTPKQEQGIFASTFAESGEQQMTKNAKPDAHTKSTWTDMTGKFQAAHTGLRNLHQSVTGIAVDAGNVFEEFIKYINQAGWTEKTFARPNSEPETLQDEPYDPKKYDSQALGAKIVYLVAKNDVGKFTDFIKLEGDPIERMQRLTTTASFPSLRQHGIWDAMDRLGELRGLVVDKIISLQASVKQRLEELKKSLNAIAGLSSLVYRESKRWPGLEIGRASNERMEVLLKNVNEFVNKNSHEELKPLLSLVLSSVWTLEANLWGLVQTYDQPDVFLFSSKKKEITETHPAELRAGIDCLLYGRVDALLVRLQGESEPDFCTQVYQKGEKRLNHQLNSIPRVVRATSSQKALVHMGFVEEMSASQIPNEVNTAQTTF
jgi:hypothetical protein